MRNCVTFTTLICFTTYNVVKWRSSIQARKMGTYSTCLITRCPKVNDTKWRIVFDASSHEKGAPSLNDTLEMGPNLLPEIFATLLRFRLNPMAIVGDIQQAFLQLQLDEDRDLTRFFWYRVTALRSHLQPISSFSVITGPSRHAQGEFSRDSSAD